MKNLWFRSILLTGALFLFGSAFQHANAQVQTAKYVSIVPNTKGYYEYLPQGYNPSGSQLHPLILFIHGMGELGDGSPANLPKVLRNGPPKLINNGSFPTSFTVNGQTHRFVVISPQFVAWPQPGDINSVINYAIANYKVDPARIYITGLSMGGGATWDYVGNQANPNYAQRTAAIVPICGAANPNVYKARMMAQANLPVWALHNSGDPTAPVSYTNDFVAYINGVVPAPNPLAKKTIFNSNSHDAWTQAYNPNYREDGKNVYEWMLTYSRSGTPPPPPTNTPPTVNAGTDKTITLPTNSVQLTATASDPGGSIASYSWSKTAGPAQFALSSTTVSSPTVSNLVAGTYTFRLTVTDNQGATASDNVNVIVNSSTTPPPPPPPPGSGRSIKVNLYGGSNAYNNSEWNNWNTNSSRTISNLKFSDGTNSGATAVLSQQNGISDNGSSFTTTMVAKEVGRYASYSTSNRTLTISGLDNSKTYFLEVYAARSGISNNRSRFAVGSNSVDILTDNNYAQPASFSSITPSGGQIVLNISRLNTYNYINGFTLTEGDGGGSTPPTNSPPVVDAGTDKAVVLPTNSVPMSITATDPNGSISTYAWTKVSGPGQFAISNETAANPSMTNLVEGTYTFRVTVTDNQGATASDNVNVVVSSGSQPPPSSGSKSVQVNVYGGSNPYNDAAWNNWNIGAGSVTNITSAAFKYSDGSNSTIKSTISQSTGLGDNGSSYPGGMAPAGVLRYTSYSTTQRTLTISGLAPSQTYDLEIYSSRNNSGNSTMFAAGTTSQTVLSSGNTTNAVVFNGVTANSSGQIVVSINRENTYSYLNGFKITEASGSGARMATTTSETSSTVEVYPNSVQDKLMIQANNNFIGTMKVQVLDINGGLKKSFNISKTAPGVSQTYISLGDLPAGEYVLTIQMGELVETKQITKI